MKKKTLRIILVGLSIVAAIIFTLIAVEFYNKLVASVTFNYGLLFGLIGFCVLILLSVIVATMLGIKIIGDK